MGKPLNSLIENALNGGVHSQTTLAEYYASGYQVSQDFFRAYAWAFVANKSGYHAGEFWEKKIWQEFKTDAEQREALVHANDLWVKVLGTTKRGQR
jgi:hypothetical protein